jgi:16S rRNA (guanine966-N2)-methyltransferase
MRVTGGTLKGWVLPHGFADHVRPSTDRMRESLFNLLEHHQGIEGATVLDLFSGSGIIAAEFISRGAVKVVSVDKDLKNIIHQKKVKSMRVEAEIWEIQKADAFKFILKSAEQYDFIFADPPYGLPDLQSLPERVLPLLRNGGWFIFEHQPQLVFKETIVLRKDYGQTSCSIFSKD